MEVDASKPHLKFEYIIRRFLGYVKSKNHLKELKQDISEIGVSYVYILKSNIDGKDYYKIGKADNLE